MTRPALSLELGGRYARPSPPPCRLVRDAGARPTPRRAMGKQKEAPRALDVARWAGLTFLDGSPIPGTTPPPPAVAEAFQILNAVAEAGTWRDPRALVRLVAPDARWVFGLDQPTTRLRLRAAVARTAWEIDRLADGIAERERAVADAQRGEKAIAAAFAALGLDCAADAPSPDFGAGGLGADAFAALDRLAALSPSYLDARRGEVAQGLAGLQRLRGELARARAAAAPRHRLPDDRRLFGLMRLAEVFALLSGEVPAFHAQRLIEATGGTERRRWWRFLRAAADIAFRERLTDAALDGSLRRLATPALVTHRWGIEDLARPDFVADATERGTLVLGWLQSFGLLIDERRGEPEPPPF